MNSTNLRYWANIAWGHMDEPLAHATVRPKPGIEIVLVREHENYALKVLRLGGPTVDEDAATIATAFAVPAAAEPVRSQRTVTHPATGRTEEQHIITWRWLEFDRAPTI